LACLLHFSLPRPLIGSRERMLSKSAQNLNVFLISRSGMPLLYGAGPDILCDNKTTIHLAGYKPAKKQFLCTTGYF
jgi:hypothetical protein